MENRIKIKEWVKKQLQKLNLKEGDLLIVTVGDKDHEPYPEMMQDLAKKFKELLKNKVVIIPFYMKLKKVKLKEGEKIEVGE